MRGTLLTLTILALALPAVADLALPAVAGAQSTGNSSIDQYQENLPGVGGDRPTGSNTSGTRKASGTGSTASGTKNASGIGATPGGSPVAPNTAQTLDKLGPDAKRTAGAAAATAPNLVGSGGSNSSGDSGYGMGWVLPVILGLSLVAALAVAVLRWRRGTPPGAA